MKTPTVYAVRYTPTQVIIVCPYCHEEHAHGLAGDDGRGHRVAHCDSDKERVGYYIAPQHAIIEGVYNHEKL